MPKNKATPLRSWNVQSYEPYGHAISSLDDSKRDPHIAEAADGSGVNGAPRHASGWHTTTAGDQGRVRKVRFDR
jgi:hypothetical protein